MKDEKSKHTVFHLLDGRIHCGASLVTKVLVSVLRDRGVDARLLTLYEGPVVKSARAEGMTVQVLPGSTPFSRWRGLVRLLQSVQAADRLPIVHSHQLRANRYASLAARWTGAAHVISVHTHKEEFIRDRFPNPVKRQIIRAIHYWTLTCANARVAVSPGVLKELQARGYDAARTQLIRNVTPLPALRMPGDDSARSVRVEWNIPDAASLVLAAGRFVPLKRFDMLLQGLAMLVRRGEHIVILLAGDGPLRVALERLTSELKLEENIRFLGWQQDLRAFIAACNCAVSCSLTECSPVFLIEAMSLERPVVAAAAEDVASLVEDGKSGMLFALDDIDGMCDAIVSVVHDTEKSERLGLAARERVHELFDEDDSARQMSELYLAVTA